MGERKDFPRLVPARPAPEDRLNSWKEIAAYLGREPRTIRRWEQSEGLPVHRLLHGKAGSVYALKSELNAWIEQRSGDSRTRVHAQRGFRRRRLQAGAIGVALLLLTTAAFLGFRKPSHTNPAVSLPLTSEPGTELEPRLSPNGAQIAYVWNGEAQDNFDIYVRSAAGGGQLRLTTNPAHDYSPAWSPDGLSIAFLRRTGAATATVFLIPALGGAERKIAEITAGGWPQWPRPGPFLTWSPDGEWLVAAGSSRAAGGDVLLRISPDTGEIRPLTSLPPKVLADIGPAFSPDGRALAFSRLVSWGRSELCVLPVSDAALPAGVVRQLQTGSSWNASPVWTPDGRSLVFSTGSMDAPYLAQMAVSDSAGAQRLTITGDNAWLPSLAGGPRGRLRLVYTQHFESVNIWRQALDGNGPPVQLISSAHWSYEPAWSADGRRIAFLSDRSGFGEIWAAGADGKGAQQWTFLKQPRLGSPRWSPDGRRIAFTAPGAQGSSIYLIDAPGAAPRPVAGSEDCGYLDWSPDGRAIYFSSNRGIRPEIWKVAVEGGTAVQMTQHGGRVPAASFDGRYLYYLKHLGPDGRNDLWRVRLGGREEEKVQEFVDAYSLGDTAIAFKYYRPGQQPVGPDLQIFRFATGKTERLPSPPRPLRYGIAVSPDGRYLLYSQADYEVSDLMLVDELR